MIEVKGLECRVDRDNSLFSFVSFTIKEGEAFLLLGESGTGKTTLLKIIAGLIDPESGSVIIDGVPQSTRSSDVHRNIGMAFQNNALFDNMTAGENIVFALRHLHGRDEVDSKEIALRLMEKLNLGDIWKMNVKELSGGMQKRLAIARALAPQPRILLLDEPVQGLDPTSSRRILSLIKEIKKEYAPTVVLISNDLTYTLPIADKIGILEKRRLRIYETRDEFLDSGDSSSQKFLRFSGRFYLD